MRANSQQVGFCFRHTSFFFDLCNKFCILYSQKCTFYARYSSIRRLQWFTEAGNDRVQEEGRGREEAKEKRGRVRIGSKGEGRKKGGRERRKRGREKKRKGEGKRGSEGEKEEGEREKKKGRKERRRKSALGEHGARSTCTLYERNPRRRRLAVVHFMHAYARLY